MPNDNTTVATTSFPTLHPVRIVFVTQEKSHQEVLETEKVAQLLLLVVAILLCIICCLCCLLYFAYKNKKLEEQKIDINMRKPSQNFDGIETPRWQDFSCDTQSETVYNKIVFPGQKKLKFIYDANGVAIESCASFDTIPSNVHAPIVPEPGSPAESKPHQNSPEKIDMSKEIDDLLEKQHIFDKRTVMPTSTRSADDVGGAFLDYPELAPKTQSNPLPNIEVKRIPKGDIPPPPVRDPYNPTPGDMSPRPFGDGATPYGPDEDEWMMSTDTTTVEPALSPDQTFDDLEMPSGTILSPQQNFLLKTPGGWDMDDDTDADKGLYPDDFVEPPEELDIGVYDKLKNEAIQAKAKLNRIQSLGIDVDALPDLPIFSSDFSEGPKGFNHQRMVSEGPKNQGMLSQGPINKRMFSEGPIHVHKRLSKDPNSKVLQYRKQTDSVISDVTQEIQRDHSLFSDVPSLPGTPSVANDVVSPFPYSAHY